ncbi:cytochrome P450 family protein [Ceratobasidium sp. AG-Ba]|nr:cytochrome P450 family protein [Ceratobasidium sp. AG-Ba]
MESSSDLLRDTVSKIGGLSSNVRSISASWLLVLLATAVFVSTFFYLNRSKLPLPPSPPKHWLWGNSSQLSPHYRHVVFGTEYKEKYGDIISLTTPSETQIILNTAELAGELLDKQAAHTSDRTYHVMANDLMNWGEAIGFQSYDERLKKSRRVIASALHLTAAKSYAAQHSDSTLDLIRLIASKPEGFIQHINLVTGAFLLRLVYGYKVTEDDPVLKVVHEAITYLGKAFSKVYWVNHLPFLKYVPAWVPGAGFQVLAYEGRQARNRMVDDSYNEVFDQVIHGRVGQPSYTSKLIEEKGGVNINKEDADLIRLTAGAMYSGRLLLTIAVVLSFILEMALHPEVAQAARNEIDSVVGRERLPILADRESLPFFEAVLLEVLRLWPPAPLGAAHLASKEIEFRGYRIPKGAALYANIWAMTHDPDLYPDPYAFNPSRFLKPNQDPDPRKYIFGFGKRLCSGIHVANNSMFVLCAGLLSTFDIVATPELATKVAALGGSQSMNMHKLSSPTGLLLNILPFSVELKLRDAAAVALAEGVGE